MVSHLFNRLVQIVSRKYPVESPAVQKGKVYYIRADFGLFMESALEGFSCEKRKEGQGCYMTEQGRMMWGRMMRGRTRRGRKCWIEYGGTIKHMSV
jgi:hypothetical protein